MQKLSYLLTISLLLFINTSCGNLQTSSYRPQGLDSLGDDSWHPSQSSHSRHNRNMKELRRKYKPKANFELDWPVDRAYLTQSFRPPRNPRHQGIDLAGDRGTPIFASHEGFVVFAGTGFTGYGKMVILEYDNQWASLYSHLNRIHVKTGDILQIGDQLGTMGRTGRATGVHLHFELIKDKQPIDPMPYLRSSQQMASK